MTGEAAEAVPEKHQRLSGAEERTIAKRMTVCDGLLSENGDEGEGGLSRRKREGTCSGKDMQTQARCVTWLLLILTLLQEGGHLSCSFFFPM